MGRAAWSDARHRHHVSRFVDLVEDPVIAHANPEEPFVAGHRLHAVRPWVLPETVYMRLEPPSDWDRKPREFVLS